MVGKYAIDGDDAVGEFRAAEHERGWFSRVVNDGFEGGEFFFHEAAGGGGEHGGEAGEGALGAVGGGEGVVDVEVGEGGEVFDEVALGVFVWFFLVGFVGEFSDVVEEDDVAWFHGFYRLFGFVAVDVVDVGDWCAEELLEGGGVFLHGGEVPAALFALVGEDDGFGFFGDEFLDGGQGEFDSGVVHDVECFFVEG